MIPNVARALACARFYCSIGLSPLPSMVNRKIPDLETYEQFYDGEPIPDSVYEEWKVPNIQVMAGAQHPGPLKIAVVDLDGEEAPEVWRRICEHHEYEPTSPWVVETGSGGMHLWYRLPPGAKECPSGMIWGVYDTFGPKGLGGWAKHKEIRILGDRALIVSPPSFHVETGKRYRFLPGCSPSDIARPEVAPAWLLAMPRLSAPKFGDAAEKPVVFRAPERLSSKHYMRGEVLRAIRDIPAEAKALGLKLAANRPNSKGWVACYVPGREEPGRSDPSGSLHATDGTFQDRKDNHSIGFFDLCCLLQPGAFSRWEAARDYFGDKYIGRIAR